MPGVHRRACVTDASALMASRASTVPGVKGIMHNTTGESAQTSAPAPPSQNGKLTKSRALGLLLGPVIFGLALWLPMPLTLEQQRLLAVVLLTVIFWVFRAVPIPVASLLALALAVLLDVAPGRQVFGAFSSSTLFLLLGCLILTRAMIKYGFGKRVAYRVLSIPGISSSTYRIVVAFGALAALLSAVMDNGALTAMLFPVALGLVNALEPDIRPKSTDPHGGTPLRFGTALLLMTAYSSTVGALFTPFGDAANLVAWQFIRERFDVAMPAQTWTALSAPIVVILFAVLSVVVLFMNRPEVRRLPEARQLIQRRRKELGPMSRGELNTALVFGLAVTLWCLPPAVAVVTGPSSEVALAMAERLHPAVVAVVAAVLLFMLPIGRSEGFTLRWRDARQVDWGPVLLMGCALALGRLMASTGLAEVLGKALAQHAGAVGVPGVYFLSAAVALLVSEMTTNLVSISVLLPILPSVLVASDGDPLTATLVAAFAGIYGFMLPISTTANAIVYGSGQVPFSRMLRTGVIVDVSGVIVIVFGVMLMLRLVTVQ